MIGNMENILNRMIILEYPYYLIPNDMGRPIGE
jgi:hypothetical protein